MKKQKLQYRNAFMHSLGFNVTVENKMTHIELSEVEWFGEFGGKNTDTAESLRDTLIQNYIKSYSKIDIHTKRGRIDLSIQLYERIVNKEKEIEELKMIIQMCKKNTVKYKETESK